MAVLLTKTMGQLNEDRKPMFPLFEKASKAIDSERTAPIAPRQSTDAQSIPESVLKTTASRASKKPKKTAKDDPKSLSTSNVFTGLIPANNSGLLEMDPNEGRRKRRKTASPNVKASKIKEDVQPSTQIMQKEGGQRKLSSPTSTRPTVVASSAEREGETVLGKQMGNEFIPKENQLIPTNDELLENHILRPAESVESGNQGDIGQSRGHQDRPSAPATVVVQTDSTPKDDPTNVPNSKHRKILYFNPKTGTIGSPPTKKKATPTDHSKPRSVDQAKRPKSKLVIIHYRHGEDSTLAIGLQIDQILKGTKIIPPITKQKSQSKSVKTQAEVIKSLEPSTTAIAKPPAVLHPFFSGRPIVKPKESTQLDLVVVDRPARFGATSLDQSRTTTNKPRAPANLNPSTFTGFQGFGSSTKLVKFPGTLEPAWPSKGMVHIRGNEDIAAQQKPSKASGQISSKAKKLKYQAIQILANEDIIGTLVTNLCVDQALDKIRSVHLDEYPPLSPCLRVPIKHFESGYHLQNRVRKELCCRLSPSKSNDNVLDEDEIQNHAPLRQSVHPALLKAYASIANTLSAFDQFRCETQPWTQKYSPKSAAEVLQTGREAIILKEWLEKLTVMSVETGSSERVDSCASSVSRKSGPSKSDTAGKRKRKPKKLDGFVVSSDEEDNDMDEISELEDAISPPGSQSLLRKTIIRANKDAPKLGNAILISGPHGCGKTAAVYAVAKELGFEVFEINSSSRRSGKDIIEKVGDMTRNHLVQHSHAQVPVEVLDEDAQRFSIALADDIQSGRQGTMNSFFKPQGVTKAKTRPETSRSATKASQPLQAFLAPNAPSKKQKQSLILFEEVDVLYEEDRQFWATVMTLVVQSKRPIIMTCNDETVVPTSLALHGILRFNPPPVDLATDYLLSVAANEGHALERTAVKSLYESRQLDLRASLTELDFWCQFAVGDIKGGLDWICPRWPVGCDADEHGRTIRVVSERTYEVGMGWLSQDVLESDAHYLDIEEETLHEAWDGWHLDLGYWHKNIDLTGWADKAKALCTSKTHERACLSMYDDFADAMSFADLCSGSAFASDDHILLDVNIPEVSDKVREDYTLDHQLLDAVPHMDYASTGSNIAHWMKSRARKYLQVDQHVKHGFEVPSKLDWPSEGRIISLIKNQISSPEFSLTRRDLSAAFDPISEPEKTTLWLSGHVEASVFDRTKTIITADLAPYVRSIVAYDAKLQEERSRMSNLLSEGGKPGKRMRTTRAAMSALEGGVRSTTRREKYFEAPLNPYLVLKTGMRGWLDAIPAATPGVEPAMTTRLNRGDEDCSKTLDGGWAG